MKTELIRIGNSRGVRIPRLQVKQVGLGHPAELRPDRLATSAKRQPRQDWKQAFLAAGSAGDDALLETSGHNEFDCKEWKW